MQDLIDVSKVPKRVLERMKDEQRKPKAYTPIMLPNIQPLNSLLENASNVAEFKNLSNLVRQKNFVTVETDRYLEANDGAPDDTGTTNSDEAVIVCHPIAMEQEEEAQSYQDWINNDSFLQAESRKAR